MPTFAQSRLHPTTVERRAEAGTNPRHLGLTGVVHAQPTMSRAPATTFSHRQPRHTSQVSRMRQRALRSEHRRSIASQLPLSNLRISIPPRMESSTRRLYNLCCSDAGNFCVRSSVLGRLAAPQRVVQVRVLSPCLAAQLGALLTMPPPRHPRVARPSLLDAQHRTEHSLPRR